MLKAGERRERRRVGIALGAGGARGLAHIGVLRTLSEAGVPIDAVVGTSIGALVGAAFAAGQLEVLERTVRSLDLPEVMRMFDPVWPRSGLLSGARAVERLTSLVGNWRIEELAVPFAAVAVDLLSGEEVIIREGRVIDAVRASISIPGVFVPFSHHRHLLVDGALRNPVPVSVLDEFDVDFRMAVNLHAQPVREIVGRGGRTRLRQGARAIGARVLDRLEERLGPLRRRGPRAGGAPREEEATGPTLFDVLTASMTILEYELARYRLAFDPPDVLLTPHVEGIRAFEFHKARRAIQSGSSETETRLPEIQRLLSRRRRRARGGYTWGSSSPSPRS